MRVHNRIFIDLKVILRPHFESDSGTEGHTSSFVFGFVAMSLLTTTSGLKLWHTGLLKLGVRIENIANIFLFAEIAVFMIVGYN